MPLAIFQNTDYLLFLARQGEMCEQVSQDFFDRMGVKKDNNPCVVVLAISSVNTLDANNALNTLIVEALALYKRNLDISRLKIVAYSSVERASKSPYLERARFIFFPDIDLREPINYPELESVLPFID